MGASQGLDLSLDRVKIRVSNGEDALDVGEETLD